MRRWAAILLLCLASFYLGATSLDQCADGVNDDCAPICHIFCADGCATVPVPETPVSPAPDLLPRLHYEAERAEHLVSLVIEPEKDPPRVWAIPAPKPRLGLALPCHPLEPTEAPMRSLLLGAMPCLLFAQAPPLSYDEIVQRARTSPEQFRTEALLAERHRALASTRGFLREGPALGVSAGPRTNPIAPTTTDQTVDLDLPLFLSQGTRSRLEASLGQADPALRGAAKVEARFRLRQAYLDAWLAEEVLHLREADLVTVQAWFKAAQVRLEAGADPAFQVTLVEGEQLRAQADLEEARRQRLNAWAVLRSLADVPPTPTVLAAPGDASLLPVDGLQARFEASALRRAIQDRLDLEEQALRHQEAIATSRWSLRGSYGKEGEGRIGKVGFAYRFPRPGEGQAVRRETEATFQATKRELETALLELDARFQSALARLQTATPPLPFMGFEQSLKAISLRLSEGKERPSEALPIRRQLLEAKAASYRRLHAAHLLSAEVQALTNGVNP